LERDFEIGTMTDGSKQSRPWVLEADAIRALDINLECTEMKALENAYQSQPAQNFPR